MQQPTSPAIELQGLDYFSATPATQARRQQAAQQQERVRQAAPPPKPMLTSPQHPARLSPQPDRLLAVKAAVSPLLEAARPLLDALAGVPRAMDPAQAEGLHRRLVSEVASFQSIGVDAGIRSEAILAASYALCTALDEAVGDALHAYPARSGADGNPWLARALAMHYHRDSDGGRKVFTILGRLWIEDSDVIDVLELYFCLLRLGFAGMYRASGRDMRTLDDIQRKLYARVDARRKQGEPAEAEHWQRLERQCIEWARTRAHPLMA